MNAVVPIDELVQCVRCETWLPTEDVEGLVCWICEDAPEDVVEEVA